MKVLLLDADGVVLNKGEYFSERFSREHNVPIEDVLQFFKGPFVLCQKGEADLKKELKPYLKKWNWSGTVEDFLDYWFSSDVILHADIESTVSQFKNMGIKCYLASNNEAYRAEAISNVLNKENLLDGSYFSAYLKVRKENPGFFKHVLNDIAVEPSEVVFVDNDQKNVDSAISVGIKAYLYEPGILNRLLKTQN